MLVILSALHAYHVGVVAAVGIFQPSGVLPGCTDLDRRLARHLAEATAVCFDPQFVSPHAGPFRGMAETANAERAVTRKTLQGGKYLHFRESSPDSALFGFLLELAVGLLCAALSPDERSRTRTRRGGRSSADAKNTVLSRYSVALLLLTSPGAHANMMPPMPPTLQATVLDLRECLYRFLMSLWLNLVKWTLETFH